MRGQADCTTSTFTASDSPDDLKVGFKLSENWRRGAYMSYTCMLLRWGGVGGCSTSWIWLDGLCEFTSRHICVCIISYRVMYRLLPWFSPVHADDWPRASQRSLEVVPIADSASVMTLAVSFAVCYGDQFYDLWNIFSGWEFAINCQLIIEVGLSVWIFSFFFGGLLIAPKDIQVLPHYTFVCIFSRGKGVVLLVSPSTTLFHTEICVSGIAMKSVTDIHGQQRMNQTDFVDQLTFHLVQPAGQNFDLSSILISDCKSNIPIWFVLIWV